MPEAYKFDPSSSFITSNDSKISEELNIIAIITPAEGKAQRLEQLLRSLCEYVEANEPETLVYHLHREMAEEGYQSDFVMVERYKNADAFAAHQQSAIFHSVGETFTHENVLAKPLVVFTTQPVAGFAMRKESSSKTSADATR